MLFCLSDIVSCKVVIQHIRQSKPLCSEWHNLAPNAISPTRNETYFCAKLVTRVALKQHDWLVEDVAVIQWTSYCLSFIPICRCHVNAWPSKTKAHGSLLSFWSGSAFPIEAGEANEALSRPGASRNGAAWRVVGGVGPGKTGAGGRAQSE